MSRWKVLVKELDGRGSAAVWSLDFASSRDAEEFIRGTAYTFPEGTLLSISPEGKSYTKLFVVRGF